MDRDLNEMGLGPFSTKHLNEMGPGLFSTK